MEDWEEQEQVLKDFEKTYKKQQELIDICSFFEKEFPDCEILYKDKNKYKWNIWKSRKFERKKQWNQHQQQRRQA